MSGDDRQRIPVPAPRLGKASHPPLAGFFGEVQDTRHSDGDTRTARGPNILSSLRKDIDLGASVADPLGPDEIDDRGFVGFS